MHNDTSSGDKSGIYRNEGSLTTEKDAVLIFAYNKIDGTLTVVEKGNTEGYLIYGLREAMQAEGG